jgi:flagellar motor switch protein FliN
MIEEIARTRFGAEVTCSLPEHAEAPPLEWAGSVLTLDQDPHLKISIELSVSPALEEALGGDAEAMEEPEPVAEAKLPMNSPDILMHVEMPVSISLGRTKMRMKDLLHLTNGSVVELDQEYGDEVEIRVNNTVIAFGEVVAVDGNYAVRVLRMAPTQAAAGLSTASPERAA